MTQKPRLIAACCALVSFPGSVTLVLDILVCGALLALFMAARERRLVVVTNTRPDCLQAAAWLAAAVRSRVP